MVNFVLDTHFEGVRVDADYGFDRYSNDNQPYLGLLTAAGDQLPSAPSMRAPSQHLGPNGIELCRRQGQCDGLFHLHEGLAGGRLPVRLRGLHVEYAGQTAGETGIRTEVRRLELECHGPLLGLGKTASSNFGLLSDNTVSKNGNFDPYSSADSYNYGALSYLQRAAERYTAGSFLNYDINDHATAYSEFMFARNTSSAAYGPSGLFAFDRR